MDIKMNTRSFNISGTEKELTEFAETMLEVAKDGYPRTNFALADSGPVPLNIKREPDHD